MCAHTPYMIIVYVGCASEAGSYVDPYIWSWYSGEKASRFAFVNIENLRTCIFTLTYNIIVEHSASPVVINTGTPTRIIDIVLIKNQKGTYCILPK